MIPKLKFQVYKTSKAKSSTRLTSNLNLSPRKNVDMATIRKGSGQVFQRNHTRKQRIVPESRINVLRHIKEVENEIEYFGDDETDMLNRQKIGDNFFFYDHDINKSEIQVFEFSLIFYIAYGVLGPFVNIYMILQPHNCSLMKNIGLFGCSPSLAFVNLIWAINCLLWVLFFYESGNEVSDYSTLFMAFIC